MSRPSINKQPSAAGRLLRFGGIGVAGLAGLCVLGLSTRTPRPQTVPVLAPPLVQKPFSQTATTTQPVAAPQLVSAELPLPPPGRLASQPSGWLPAKAFEEPKPPLSGETGAQLPEDGQLAPPAFDLPLPPPSLVPEVWCSGLAGPTVLEPIPQPVYGLQVDGMATVELRPTASAKRLREAQARKLSCKGTQQYMSLKDKALLDRPAIAELKIPAEVPEAQPGLLKPVDSILTTSSQDSLIDLGR